MSLGTHVSNAARGTAIGIAEAIPGVSGGTIALVTGVYERIIISAGHLVSAVRTAVTDLGRGRGPSRPVAHLKQVGWPLLIMLAVGMVPGILLAARFIEPLLEHYPQQIRGLFFGLVLASIMVPASMIGGRWRPREIVASAIAALAAFVLTGLPEQSLTPRPVIILLAAAVAVCALVLPGVSGSFLLLSIGMYAPTIAAVNDRDLGYLAIFALGAILGLSLFVRLLQWLLEHRHRITLAIMVGIIAGSLRALWPWQTEDRTLLAPSGEVPATILFFLIGFAVVAGAFWLEHRTRKADPVDDIKPREPQGIPG